MTMPAWWGERRFGLIVHASAAAVPAWAPIGESAEWYRGLLDDDVADVSDSAIHPRPMVEVLAHHRDRWGHIERYDDYASLLTFDQFDAEAWADLTRASGAGYLLPVAKHHDGWAWWDAPGTERRVVDTGPQRNVLTELAAACERNDIVFGASYSLLDWGVDTTDDDAASDRLHADIADLVERLGVRALWGDAHQRHDAGHWRIAELLATAREHDPELVINDRWWASGSDVPDGAPGIVRTFDQTVPADIVEGPWELRRPIGFSAGHNRNERAEHQLTGHEIVDLFTEVVAKGGHLALSIGAQADGALSPMQSEPLLDAGTWIRRHSTQLSTTRPWTTWGDHRVRYLCDDNGLIAIDVSGAGTFSALDPSQWRVTSVEVLGVDTDAATQVAITADPIGVLDHHVEWEQTSDGLHITRRPAPPVGADDPIGIAAYRVSLEPVEQPVELFGALDAEPTPLGPLLDAAEPGSIVQLGDGVYTGPALVPADVTLRGLGTDRTTILSPPDNTIIPTAPAATLGAGARLEHLAVASGDTPNGRSGRLLVAVEGNGASILGCSIDGTVTVAADDVLVRAVTGQGLIAINADRLHVSRCNFSGNRWDTGIELRSGGGQLIESNRLADHLCAIRVIEATGAIVRGNTITARWWGVHLDHTHDAHVRGNRVKATMRAVDVDGGIQAVVDGNAVIEGDSGCIVQDGAANCEVYGNHWDRCRIGLLAWDATSLRHQDNVCSGLHEPDSAFISGPS